MKKLKSFLSRNTIKITDASVNCMLGGIGLLHPSDILISFLIGTSLLPIQEIVRNTNFSILRFFAMLAYGMMLAVIPWVSQFCMDLEYVTQIVLRTLAHFLYWANWSEKQ